MAKFDSTKLEQLSKEDLLKIITDVTSNVPDVASYIQVNYLTSPDKKINVTTGV